MESRESVRAWAPLDEGRLQRELVGSGVCSRVVRVDSTGSTTADLVEAARREDFAQQWPHASVLTSEEQTAGAGRTGRAWASPRGASLSTSVVLRPSLPASQRHWLSLVSGLALVQTLDEDYGLDASLKWPNDVLIGAARDEPGRKIAGSAAVAPPGARDAVIVGCGINVLLGEEDLPTETAASLLLESRAPLSDDVRTDLLIAWLSRFQRLSALSERAGDIAPVRPMIVERISTIGQQVRVHLPGEERVMGTAVRVEEDGALTVETAQGPRSFYAGDVVHLRRDT